MEFYEVINKRRSIRQFGDKEIPREVLERILDAGLKAPSSNHQRRWELVTLTDKNMIMELAKFIRPYPCRNGGGPGFGRPYSGKKEPEQIKDFLKVPDGWALPALVVLGYAVKEPLLPSQVRATVENKVRWNKW